MCRARISSPVLNPSVIYCIVQQIWEKSSTTIDPHMHYPTCSYSHSKKCKVMVSCAFVPRGIPIGEATYPRPMGCEVGWPVPFIRAVDTGRTGGHCPK